MEAVRPKKEKKKQRNKRKETNNECDRTSAAEGDTTLASENVATSQVTDTTAKTNCEIEEANQNENVNSAPLEQGEPIISEETLEEVVQAKLSSESSNDKSVSCETGDLENNIVPQSVEKSELSEGTLAANDAHEVTKSGKSLEGSVKEITSNKNNEFIEPEASCSPTSETHTLEEIVEETVNESNALSLEQLVEEAVNESNELLPPNTEVSCPPASEMPILPHTTVPLYPKKELEQLKVESKIFPKLLIKKVVAEETEEDLDSIRPFLPEQLMALYQNVELKENINFVDYFVQHEKEPQNSEFYELLKCYLRARINLVASENEMQEKKFDMNQHMENVWQMIPKTISNKLPCADGVTVTGVHQFLQAQLNQSALTLLSNSLQELKEHVQVTYVIHAYTCEVVRLQIESFLYGLLNLSSFRNTPRNAPVVALRVNEIASEQWNDTALLRGCISDLFSFQRKLVKDVQFVNDTRQWLTRLVAVLLRHSTLNEHLFLLNHVLRCPAGVGQWGAIFVQFLELRM